MCKQISVFNLESTSVFMEVVKNLIQGSTS